MAAKKSENNPSWENRRQSDRVNTQLAMEYRVLQNDAPTSVWNTTITKDISLAGVCFESFHPLSLNMILEVKLSSESLEEPVMLKARIVRAHEILPGEIYGVAAAIIDISEANRERLQLELRQVSIGGLLRYAIEEGASDIHLTLGHPPVLRKAGNLITLKSEPLNREELKKMVFSLLSDDDINKFFQNSEVTTTISFSDLFRFRLNIYTQQSTVEAIFHLIKLPIPSLDELNLPEVVKTFTRKKSGLVLVSGLTGSGKTTTCAAMIDFISSERSSVIMTFEKPIEYVYALKKSIIKQLEIGVDTDSFSSGLKQALRQNPDVLMVSEMPDIETMEVILDAAQTGQLIFVPFFTPNVVATISKLVYEFPAKKQEYIRKVLSNCLQGIISQTFLPMKDNKDEQIVATEVLVNTPEVAEIIREGTFEKLESIMNNDTMLGMHTMSQSMEELAAQGLINTPLQ